MGFPAPSRARGPTPPKLEISSNSSLWVFQDLPSGFRQGFFRVFFGNISGIFRDNSGNIPEKSLPSGNRSRRGIFREYFGNISGIFREYSAIIRGIFPKNPCRRGTEKSADLKKSLIFKNGPRAPCAHTPHTHAHTHLEF